MEAFFLNDAHQYLEIEVDPHGRYIGLLLDGQRNAVYISGPQFFKVNLNYSGSMVDVTQETRGVMIPFFTGIGIGIGITTKGVGIGIAWN